VIRIDRPRRRKGFHLRHRDAAAGRRHRIEVPRRFSIDEIAVRIATKRLHDRKVRDQASFEHVALSPEQALFLAFGHCRADPGTGVEAGDARATGPHPLGQRALRIELDLQRAGQILALELLVLADIGRDHPAHLARGQQQAQAEILDAGIVRDDGEVSHAAIADRRDQGFGDAAKAEPARRDGHPVEQQSIKCLLRAGEYFRCHADLTGLIRGGRHRPR